MDSIANRSADVVFTGCKDCSNEERDPYKSALTEGWDYTIAVYLILLALTAMGLNGTVIATLCRRRSKLTGIEIYIFNLCVCGLIPSAISYMFPMMASLNHGWITGQLGCTVDAFIVCFFGMVSIGQLWVISLWRYFKMFHNQKEMRLSKHFYQYTILMCYAYGALWAVPPLFGWGSYSIEPFGTACSIAWKYLTPSYLVTLFITGYVLPLFTMIFCFARMIRFVSNMYARTTNPQMQSKAKLVKIATLLCSCYMFTWTPYTVVGFISAFDPSLPIDPLVSAIPCVFAKSAIVWNPIVYFFIIRRFREETRECGLYLRPVKKNGYQTCAIVKSTAKSKTLSTTSSDLITVGTQTPDISKFRVV